jgi:hypothetical protein
MPEQNDDHCIMNVDWRPWRIQSIRDGRYMTVVNAQGVAKIADLSVLNFDEYCANAAEWLKEESARLARIEAFQAARRADNARWVREMARREKERVERELECYWRERQQAIRQSIGYAQLLASGYGPIDDLEREVVLADLEDTDAETILAVDCQTFHLERLEA